MNDTIKVPGSTIYYEAQGSGPVLLMIPGGPADPFFFSGLIAELTDRYTVVVYDPRGNGRSVMDDPEAAPTMDEHGDDAAALIDHVGGAPVYVFGSSGGGQIGLNLAARHPAKVLALVAHEPPSFPVLPDGEETMAGARRVGELYRTEGQQAAWEAFEKLIGMENQQQQEGPPPPPPVQEAIGRMMGNMPLFLSRSVPVISTFRPDLETLRAGAPKIVVGVGEESAKQGHRAYRAGIALAEQLGGEPAWFPGDHGGFGSHASEFAVTLDRVLHA